VLSMIRIAASAVCLAAVMTASAPAQANQADDCQRNVNCTVQSVLSVLDDKNNGSDRYRMPVYGFVALAMQVSGAPAEEMSALYARIRTAIAGMDQIPNSIDRMVALMIADDFLNASEPRALNTVGQELQAEIARRNEQMRQYGTMSPLCKAAFTLLSAEIGYDPAMRKRVEAATSGLPDCRERIGRALAEQDERSGIAFAKVFIPEGGSFLPKNRDYRHYQNLMIAFGGRDQVRQDAIAEAWLAVTQRRAKRGRVRADDALTIAMFLTRAGYPDKAEEVLGFLDMDDLRETYLSSALDLFLPAITMRNAKVRELLRPVMQSELALVRSDDKGFSTIDHPDSVRVMGARLLLAADLDENGWQD
jgi:hypothetical protein